MENKENIEKSICKLFWTFGAMAIFVAFSIMMFWGKIVTGWWTCLLPIMFTLVEVAEYCEYWNTFEKTKADWPGLFRVAAISSTSSMVIVAAVSQKNWGLAVFAVFYAAIEGFRAGLLITIQKEEQKEEQKDTSNN